MTTTTKERAKLNMQHISKVIKTPFLFYIRHKSTLNYYIKSSTESPFDNAFNDILYHFERNGHLLHKKKSRGKQFRFQFQLFSILQLCSINGITEP